MSSQGQASAWRSDRGSTLVMVLVVMIILTLAGLVTASVVTNTMRSVVATRSATQARASADAGITAGLVAFMNGVYDQPEADPLRSEPDPRLKYEVFWTRDLDAKTVTFISRGYTDDGAQTRTRAMYAYEEPSAGVEVDELTFFGQDMTMLYEMPAISATKFGMSINNPGGTFICQGRLDADLKLAGRLEARGNCRIKGDLHVGGNIVSGTQTDRIGGNLTASASTGTNRFAGTVGGDYRAGTATTSLDTYGDQIAVGGNLVAAGDVIMYDRSIQGSATVPSGKSFKSGWSNTEVPAGSHPKVLGGVSRPATVAPPSPPVMIDWHDYTYRSADWPGYVYKKLNSAECLSFNDHTGVGWAGLSDYTSPVVIDATGCTENGFTGLTSNNGSAKTATIQTNIVLLAKRFKLSNYLTIKPAPGKDPRMWFMVPDETPDGKPAISSCSSNAGEINLNNVTLTVPSMLYTPYCIRDSGGGQFVGTMYGVGLIKGGSLTIDPVKVTFPGGSSGGHGGSAGLVLGAVIERWGIA